MTELSEVSENGDKKERRSYNNKYKYTIEVDDNVDFGKELDSLDSKLDELCSDLNFIEEKNNNIQRRLDDLQADRNMIKKELEIQRENECEEKDSCIPSKD